MNAYNELKLRVYEDTSLDWDEKKSLIEMMESCDDEDLQDVCESVEVVLEGATIEMNKILKNFKKTVKPLMNEAKKSYKAKDYDTAIKKLNEAKDLTKKAEEEVKSLDAGKIGAVICGQLYANFVEGLKVVLLSLVTFGVGGVIVTITGAIKQINGIIAEFKENDSVDLSMLNHRYTMIRGTFVETNKSIDKMIAAIEKEQKAASKEDKESEEKKYERD